MVDPYCNGFNGLSKLPYYEMIGKIFRNGRGRYNVIFSPKGEKDDPAEEKRRSEASKHNVGKQGPLCIVEGFG